MFTLHQPQMLRARDDRGMEVPRADEILEADELKIRAREGLALVAGRAVPLSVREFQLLCALVRRQGGIVSRAELYSEVWGGELRNGDRSIDVYVHKLRSKLESALPHRRFIHTHVGFGYRFSAEPSHPFHTPATPA